MHNSSIKQARPIDNLLQFSPFVNNELENEKGLFEKGVGSAGDLWAFAAKEVPKVSVLVEIVSML